VAVIASLSLRSQHASKVDVTLDDGTHLRIAKILAVGLRVGQGLSPEEILDLRNRDGEESIFQSALRLVHVRPRSEAELRRTWAAKKVDPQVQSVVMARLRRAGLVNDEAFAHSWVENRMAFRPRGQLALRTELHQKGVPPEVIQVVLADVDDDEVARQAALKAARKLSSLPPDRFRQRLGEHLRRRGFSFETINRTVERVMSELVNDDDESEVLL